MNSRIAIVPDGRDVMDVTMDRTLVAPPVNLTGAIGELVDTLKGSLTRMDDITLEITGHSDAARSSVHVKIRGYRRPER